MHTVGLLAPTFVLGSLYSSYQAFWVGLFDDFKNSTEGPINPAIKSSSFGIFYACALLSSLSAEFVMNKIGRKFTVVLGTLLTTIAAACFISLPRLSKTAFVAMSIGARCAHGLGYGYIVTADFAIFGIAYKDSVSLLMALFELTLGMGFSLGPFIGSGLNYLGGFELIMIFFTVLGGAFLMVAFCFISKADVDVRAEDDMDPLILFDMRKEYIEMRKKEADKKGMQVNESEIFHTASMLTPKEVMAQLPANSYCYLLRIPRVLIASLSCFVLVHLFAYQEPLTEPHFREHYGVDQNLIGVIIALPFLLYSVSSFLSSKILQTVHCRGLMLFGFVASGIIFLTLFGPSKLLHFPDNVYICVVGLALARHFQGYIFVSLIPELMEGTAPHCYRGEIPPEVADKLAVIFNFFFDTGGVTAPFIGVALEKATDYRTAGDIMGLVAIAWAIIIVVIVGEKEIFKSRQVKVSAPVVWSRAISSNLHVKKVISNHF